MVVVVVVVRYTAGHGAARGRAGAKAMAEDPETAPKKTALWVCSGMRADPRTLEPNTRHAHPTWIMPNGNHGTLSSLADRFRAGANNTIRW